MKVNYKLDFDKNKHLVAVRDDKLWLFAAEEWHRLITPYTPMDSGDLFETVQIRPKEIEYTSPYAHYQYKGLVMGPNFYDPDFGFWSPPGKPKSYTGKSLTYKTSKHPLASKEWDKAAEPTQKPKLIKSMQGYINSGRLKI